MQRLLVWSRLDYNEICSTKKKETKKKSRRFGRGVPASACVQLRGLSSKNVQRTIEIERSEKAQKRKRQLRGSDFMETGDANLVKRLLPYS